MYLVGKLFVTEADVKQAVISWLQTLDIIFCMGTNACMSVMTTWKSDVYHPVPRISILALCWERLRWSRGSVLASGTQVRGFKPDRSSRIFQGEKFLSAPSFRKEVNPFLCVKVAAFCLNYRPFLAQVVPPFITSVSGGETWRCK